MRSTGRIFSQNAFQNSRGQIDPDEEDVVHAFFVQLWGWKPKGSDSAKVDWKRIYAFVCQTFGVRPYELGQMTQVEIYLYVMNYEKTGTDKFSGMVLRESIMQLTLEEKIKLADMKYRLDTV